jgi:hypothetical protein
MNNLIFKPNGANGIAYYVGAWVLIGSLTGAVLSGCHKIGEILGEPSKEKKFTYPLFERPIQGVYTMSRIAGHAGFGAFIAGFCALTAPVTIPLYIMCVKDKPVVPTVPDVPDVSK